MLHISKLIDDAKEIKSQIGSKTHDLKVVEYYEKLSDGIDLYPKKETINNIISFEIEYWGLLLEKEELLDVDKKRLKKLGLPHNIDITTLTNSISDIISHRRSNVSAEEPSIQDIENLSFSRSLFFYLFNLSSIKEYRNTYGWLDDDFKREIKTIPENLNFIKDYIKEIARLDFDEMCRRYSKVVGNVKKTEHIQGEIKEYSIILNSHISSKDWEYLDKSFDWCMTGLRPEGFDIEDMPNIHSLLMDGDFYLVIYRYNIGVHIVTLLLKTEMYVEFLQSQISNTKSLENKSIVAVGSAKDKARVTDDSFKLNREKHEIIGKEHKSLLDHAIATDLKDMMRSLKSKNYIHNKTTITNFQKIFSGDKVNEKVIWTGRKNHLRYFIKTLYERNKLKTAKGGQIWHVAHKCFDVTDLVDIVDGNDFSENFRKEKAIADIDKDQLNACINHLRIRK